MTSPQEGQPQEGQPQDQPNVGTGEELDPSKPPVGTPAPDYGEPGTATRKDAGDPPANG